MSTENDFNFADLNLRECVHRSISDAGFKKPTPIQAAAIPPALEGKDVIGLAQTGTGKTAAFAIPIIERMANRAELGGLVLAPTRELAAQITESFTMLGHNTGTRVATIVGGVPMDQDYTALSSWPNVLVATPGRLIDHLESKTVSLNEVEVFAVDEADRMHDMGFIPQIRQIISFLPPERQTLMFTATMHDDVERIARQSMKDPVRVQIGVTAPANRAKQELFELSEDAKAPLLLQMLAKTEGRTLVFLRTKRGVDRLARRISGKRFRVGRIHGDLEQEFRDKALNDFREGRTRILVATDIAARGLDISNIEHVINFDFPHNPEDYVHHIGRTARIDASGLASSFITRNDRRFVTQVRRLIGDKLPQATRLDTYGDEPEKPHAGDKGGSRGGKGRRRSGSGPRGRGGRGRKPAAASKTNPTT